MLPFLRAGSRRSPKIVAQPTIVNPPLTLNT
jgi:hypothetical protein